MKSKTVERLLKEMEDRPWHHKLRDWWRVKLHVWACRTRLIWDLRHERNIFRRSR